MPEGHTVHRIAREFTKRFVGQPVELDSPQGRFAAESALVTGQRMLSAEAHGKQLFIGFANQLSIRVHLGIYGKWQFSEVEEIPEPKGAVRARFLAGKKLADLRGDLARLETQAFPDGPYPWNALWLWAETALSLEGQEALVALMLEPHGALIDGLGDCMDADEVAAFALDGSISIAAFRTGLHQRYAWALGQDYDQRAQAARFWYVSEEKLEPRLGERFDEDGAALELPIGTARMVADLDRTLAEWPADQPLAGFLLAHPEYRFMARRVQQSARHPYAEIHDNLLAADMLPIDILRCKLAFFGASHFDPRSDRWVRIALFQGLPYPDEVTKEPQDA